jgi:hypothetical protein
MKPYVAFALFFVFFSLGHDLAQLENLINDTLINTQGWQIWLEDI